jgi:hypothetical protein
MDLLCQIPTGKHVRLYKPYYEAQCLPATLRKKTAIMYFSARVMIVRNGEQCEFLKKLAKKCTDLGTAPNLQSVMLQGLECFPSNIAVVVPVPPRLHSLCT